MGRFKYIEADRYGGTGKSDYLSLPNDRDKAKVRFMYNSIEDVEGIAVHQVTVDGKYRYVNCLRDYNSPLDDCPFCRSGNKQLAKIYVPIFNRDEQRVQVWERGKTIIPELSSLCARYSNSTTPLCAQPFEIERRGVKGDTNTTYGIYPDGPADNTKLQDLPEPLPILGKFVLDKSAEDMEFYIETGKFPPEDETAVRRPANTVSDTQESYSRREYRRTPANSGRNVF